MIKSMTKKRLDKIEIQLTPQEWAIRFVDEMRKYPTETAFLKVIAVETSSESLIFKPFLRLAEQAEERFSGKKPEDIRVRNHLVRKLQTDWHMLKNLIFTVNEKTNIQTESTGLKTTLKLSTLQVFCLQDALGLTAGKVAEWVGKYKTNNNEDVNNRQVMLRELVAFRDHYFGGTFNFPLGSDICIFFQGHIEGWIQDITMLISDIFAHETAIKIIQDKYFDGHPILFKDTETRLVETIKTLKDGVATFNEYMKVRKELFNAERDQEDRVVSAMQGECDGQLIIDVEAIKVLAVKENAVILANAWIKFEREKTVADFLEEPGEYEAYIWRKFRESFGLSS